MIVNSFTSGVLHSDNAGTISSSSVTNSDLAGSITYDKLILTGSIQDSDINTGSNIVVKDSYDDINNVNNLEAYGSVITGYIQSNRGVLIENYGYNTDIILQNTTTGNINICTNDGNICIYTYQDYGRINLSTVFLDMNINFLKMQCFKNSGLLKSDVYGNITSSTFSASDIPTNTITYDKIQQCSNNTVLGNISGSLGNVTEVTIDSATSNSTIVQRDSGGNVYATGFYAGGSGIMGTFIDAPIGAIIMWPSITEPGSGAWKTCNGQAISRTTYSPLYSIIGNTFGAGDGSTTFNLPDFRQRVPYGYQVTTNPMATTGGSATHTLSTAELPSHTHDTSGITVSVPNNYFCNNVTGAYSSSWKGGSGAVFNMGTSASISGNTGSTGSGTAFSIMNPYLSVNFIIKVL